jgi:uncharacterized protein
MAPIMGSVDRVAAIESLKLDEAPLELWRRSARGSRVQPPAPADAMPRAAWAGLREFSVARREFEDAAQPQCSFYLEPVDGAVLPPFLPGQFLTFELNTGEARTLTRCYSLSDRPLSTSYRVTRRRALRCRAAGWIR